VRLDPDDIEAIARHVAKLIADSLPPPPAVRYVDAAEVARALSVERDWVYAHAGELGAVRLGGSQGRLRFDLRELPRLVAERGPGRERRSTGAARGAELTSSSRRALDDPASRRQGEVAMNAETEQIRTRGHKGA
jgi:hypothetical protein